MKTLTIKLPDYLDLDEREVKTLIAVKLFEKKSLSLGQASDFLGVSKDEFAGILTSFDVPVINHSPEDIERDLENAQKYCL